jgi:hypothetical protein
VGEQRAWAVRVTLLAPDTERQAIVDRIGAAICSPPDHQGPCTNPWSIVSTPVDDLEDTERSVWLPSVDELLEQRQAERRLFPRPDTTGLTPEN